MWFKSQCVRDEYNFSFTDRLKAIEICGEEQNRAVQKIDRTTTELRRQMIITNRNVTLLLIRGGPPLPTTSVVRYLPIKSRESADALMASPDMIDQFHNFLHLIMPEGMEAAPKYWREIFSEEYMGSVLWLENVPR
jgi:hypothetical protein